MNTSSFTWDPTDDEEVMEVKCSGTRDADEEVDDDDVDVAEKDKSEDDEDWCVDDELEIESPAEPVSSESLAIIRGLRLQAKSVLHST